MASEKKVKMETTSIVEISISVPTTQSWGEDCTLKQVIKQSNDSADLLVRKAFAGAKGVRILSTNIKIVSSKETK